MMTLSTRVLGVEALQAKLHKGERLKEELHPEMRAAVQAVWREIPGYPPPPPASTYQRTGKLGRSVRSWQGGATGAIARVEPYGGGVRGYVGSALPYAGYVIGDRQAWMHRGRWWQMRQVVRGAAPAIARALGRGVYRILS